jgi:triphosphatase
VVGVSADSMDIARGIGERDGEAFSDRPKTGVSDDPGFDPPLSFDARQANAELSRLTEPAALFAGKTLERLHKRALKRGRGLLQKPPEDRHEVRIVLKNIRYTVEFFSSFFESARPYLRAVAKLQDGLGAFNDAASATQHLRDVEAAAGPQAAKAAGIVLGWCGRGAANADDNLRQTWKAFKQTRPFWS